MRRAALCGTTVGLVMLLACAPSSDRGQATGDTTTREPAALDADGHPPTVFDPPAMEVGDSVSGLVIEDLKRERTLSGEWIGSARFGGTLPLTGRTFAHPDGADYPFPCFEVDSASSRLLPRWKGDERRPWFCFENPEESRSILGGPTPGRAFSIRIDRFTIHRNLTDAVNSARLLGLAGNSGDAAIECYRAPASVLARRPGSVADGPPGLVGWIRLDGRAAGDSGSGRLIDSDGRWLGAAWRRAAGDTIAVTALDDFLRVEMRLAVTDSAATGSALARSDAGIERDSTGKRVEFRREWTVTAPRVSCDSLPSNASDRR